MFGFGPWELMIVAVLVFILFGAGKLPELGSGIGEGIKNLKKGLRDANAIDVTPEETQTTLSKKALLVSRATE